MPRIHWLRQTQPLPSTLLHPEQIPRPKPLRQRPLLRPLPCPRHHAMTFTLNMARLCLPNRGGKTGLLDHAHRRPVASMASQDSLHLKREVQDRFGHPRTSTFD